MPELKITQKVKNSHQHIVYTNEATGAGATSVSQKHTHPVIFIPPDPMAGGEGYWEVQEENGHTHSIIDYTPKPAPRTETDDELVAEVMEHYKAAMDFEKESRDNAHEAEKIYCNEQWPNTVLNDLPLHRSAVTINKVKKNIDGLSGYQRQHRTDWIFYPTENGDQRVADILKVVVKNIAENCYYHREETRVFEDQAITGRGNFNTLVDRERNLMGDIIIECYPWNEVYYGPHSKDDLSDCEYLCKVKMLSEQKVKALYPDKADQLQPQLRVDDEPKFDTENKEDPYASPSKTFGKEDDGAAALKKQYLEIERWKKEYKRVFILVNPADEFFFNAEGWQKADVDAAMSIEGFRKVPRVTYQMRMTKVLSGTLLDDMVVDEWDDFPLTPVYATKRRGKWWGKIYEVVDLQRAVNKAYSQFVDIINKMVAYGWFYDSETFANNKEKEDFKRNSSSPGWVAEVQDLRKVPMKEEGVKFPVELSNFLVMLNNDLKEIMSINLEMLGLEGPSQTGVAIKQKIAQQLLGNDFLFDNLAFAKKKIGRQIVKLIQEIYTPERIYRIVNNQNQKEEVMVGGQPLAAYDRKDILDLLQDDDLTKYDVIVAESSESPSAQVGNFLSLLELAGRGIPIPPDVIIDFAPIPNKDRIKAAIAAQNQAEAQQEQQKMDTEIQKTIIAQQGKIAAKNQPNIRRPMQDFDVGQGQGVI